MDVLRDAVHEMAAEITLRATAWRCIHMYICIYVYIMYVCICIYICIYIYIYMDVLRETVHEMAAEITLRATAWEVKP